MLVASIRIPGPLKPLIASRRIESPSSGPFAEEIVKPGPGVERLPLISTIGAVKTKGDDAVFKPSTVIPERVIGGSDVNGAIV